MPYEMTIKSSLCKLRVYGHITTLKDENIYLFMSSSSRNCQNFSMLVLGEDRLYIKDEFIMVRSPILKPPAEHFNRSQHDEWGNLRNCAVSFNFTLCGHTVITCFVSVWPQFTKWTSFCNNHYLDIFCRDCFSSQCSPPGKYIRRSLCRKSVVFAE